MGLSYEDCKRLGIEHLWPEVRSDSDILRHLFGIREDTPPIQAAVDGLNKTERAFAELLEAHNWPYLSQSLKLRLAGRTWYTPDFVIFAPHLCCIEIKGYMRDDASVKLKVAAELYPQFGWLLVRREGRHGWEVREVTNRGIGTSPIRVPWIHGG